MNQRSLTHFYSRRRSASTGDALHWTDVPLHLVRILSSQTIQRAAVLVRIRLVPSCRQRRQSVKKGTESPRIAAHTTKSDAILAPPTTSLQLPVWWGCASRLSGGPSGATVSLRGGLLLSGGVERQPGDTRHTRGRSLTTFFPAMCGGPALMGLFHPVTPCAAVPGHRPFVRCLCPVALAARRPQVLGRGSCLSLPRLLALCACTWSVRNGCCPSEPLAVLCGHAN